MKRRTTIEIDDELVNQAKAVLGTKGLRDTVEAALDEIVKSALRERLIRRLQDPEGIDWDALMEARRSWRT